MGLIFMNVIYFISTAENDPLKRASSSFLNSTDFSVYKYPNLPISSFKIIMLKYKFRT
jgi:hypothetical protein